MYFDFCRSGGTACLGDGVHRVHFPLDSCRPQDQVIMHQYT